MKNIISLIISFIWVCVSTVAQTVNTAVTVNTDSIAESGKTVASIQMRVDSGVKTVELRIDSSAVVANTDYTRHLEEGEALVPPQITIEDGMWNLVYDGKTYAISDLVSQSDEFACQEREMRQLSRHSRPIFMILFYVFGLPCISIVTIVVVALVYSNRRNRARNKIIEKAIEGNYPLPEEFYMPQSKQKGENTMRDTGKFYAAITLMAVGIALLVAGVLSQTGFWIVVGLVPLLIGIGRMLGYFYVPQQPRQRFHPPYMPYGQQMPYDQPMPGQPMPGQYPPQNPAQEPWCPAAPEVNNVPEEPAQAAAPDDEMTPPPYRPQ